MRYLAISLMALIIVSPAISAEVTANLDRCVVLNAENDNTAESKIAMHFALPEEVSEKEVVYAEIYIPIQIQRQDSDSLFEFRLYPLLSGWSEDEIDFENSEDITDSLSAGAYTVMLGEANEFHIDITSFVREATEGERPNHGLIAIADLLGDANIRLPENLDGPIRTSARVRIVYK